MAPKNTWTLGISKSQFLRKQETALTLFGVVDVLEGAVAPIPPFEFSPDSTLL